ncbi:polysaccharide deacetylase family protein [Tengunoibacter tsumagoiensis]|uniref:NodB homology domain-containing protein n=1 Tax=Tengunoibacter tsumagoiensis TaxID=2014871 RepID=A0A401ZY40_9CHLR|nr:polysaccharide deacetylase family protein [Tengunoibacter tsumagoiensis]GCE11743.1 hypothetical protein KTT_16020 [Tengunoibacter tsumagoiensis]
MLSRLRMYLAAGLYYTGALRLYRMLNRETKPQLLILKYHRATGHELRQQFQFLRRYYRLLSIEEALQELFAAQPQVSRDRRPPLVISFDDGYRDFYTEAFPLAKELNIPLTVYLIPGYIERGDFFWWFEDERLISRAQVEVVTLDQKSYRLQEPAERAALKTYIADKLRLAPSVTERDAFLWFVRRALAVPSTVQEEDLPMFPLLWEQVEEMAKSGLISFGAHSQHHPQLERLTETSELQREVAECRLMLEARLGHPVQSFAYPVEPDTLIAEKVLKAVKQAGYRWALTSTSGVNTPESDPFQLKRIESSADEPWLILATKLAALKDATK